MRRSKVNISKLVSDIKSIKIQGATAVAKWTLEALEQLFSELPAPQKADDWKKFFKLADQLSQLRPTEPLARNLSRWYINILKSNWSKHQGKMKWLEYTGLIGSDCNYKLKEINSRLTEKGSTLVKSKQVIFTHCHSSLAEEILIKAKNKLKNFKVYHTETRPLFQGHITAGNLKKAGIKATLVADGAASWLVSNHSGDDIKVNWVLLGADSLSTEGAVINKIGSFAIALAAYDSQIPVYIATSLLKMDINNKIKIELRSADELWPAAPHNISIVNYAFDQIPAKYITGLITEFGIIKPNQAYALVKKNYPELLK